MKIKNFIFFFLLFCLQNICFAQFRKQIDSLTAVCNIAASDSEKVVQLGKLADLYYTFKLNKKGDSILRHQLLIADLSNNNNLVLIALFGDAITNISPSTSKDEFDKTIQFLEKGINYAKSQNQYDYLALAYVRMANLLRKRGESEKALNNANLAVQGLQNVKSDSIKVVIYIELGNTYQARNESVLASTNYNTAYDLAYKIKSVPLQSDIYHCFSEMYVSLGHIDIAKEELMKSLALNKQHGYNEGLLRDFYDLARITDEKFFIEKTIALADSLKLSKYILKAKSLMFYYYMVAEKNGDKALQYLEQEPDVKESIQNIGTAYFNRTIGQVFLWSKKGDSALHYFKMAEEDYVNNFDPKLRRGIFKEIAESYKLQNDMPNAILYYNKVMDLSRQISDAVIIASTSSALSGLYEKLGDFKQAFIYSKQAIAYQDSLRKLSEGREIALLNVERENRKHAEESRREAERLIDKRNLQYFAITIAIAAIFTFMLILGMFPISKLTIKMLGYFFFISLFEFIVLLIDNFLHQLTHGEPLKIWLIKIFLIALLVPLQHFLEHRLIKFLESRKLLEARTKFSLKKWMSKAKKPALHKEADFEEGTAVL